MGKLINRIPGECLLISSLPGSASKTLVEPLGKPRDVNKYSLSICIVLVARRPDSVIYDGNNQGADKPVHWRGLSIAIIPFWAG